MNISENSKSAILFLAAILAPPILMALYIQAKFWVDYIVGGTALDYVMLVVLTLFGIACLWFNRSMQTVTKLGVSIIYIPFANIGMFFSGLIASCANGYCL